MVRGVVFDFDGTLADTREAVVNTVNRVLVAAGHPRVAGEWIHRMMGLPLGELLQKAIPRTQRPEDTGRLEAAYRETFLEVGLPQVRPMPEAEEVLGVLRQREIGLAIATSREAVTLRPLIEAWGWDSWFRVIATCDLVTQGKPAPDLLLWVLQQTGWSADDTVMVGDTRWDVEMATRVGVRAVGVTHGSHDARTLREAGASEVYPDLRGVLGVGMEAQPERKG